MVTYSFSVDWFGPFKGTVEARAWTQQSEYVPGNNSQPPSSNDPRKPTGLYLAIGSINPWRLKLRNLWVAFTRRNQVQYVGLGNVVQRLGHRTHHIATHMRGTPQIWVGALSDNCTASHAASIDDKRHDNQIVLAEWLLIYFLEPTLCLEHRDKPPSTPCTLVNRWFLVENGAQPRALAQSPHATLPDMVVWPYAGEPHSKPPAANLLPGISAGKADSTLPQELVHAGLFFVSGRDGKSTFRVRCKKVDARACRQPDRRRLFRLPRRWWWRR